MANRFHRFDLNSANVLQPAALSCWRVLSATCFRWCSLPLLLGRPSFARTSDTRFRPVFQPASRSFAPTSSSLYPSGWYRSVNSLTTASGTFGSESPALRARWWTALVVLSSSSAISAIGSLPYHFLRHSSSHSCHGLPGISCLPLSPADLAVQIPASFFQIFYRVRLQVGTPDQQHRCAYIPWFMRSD